MALRIEKAFGVKMETLMRMRAPPGAALRHRAMASSTYGWDVIATMVITGVRFLPLVSSGP